MSPKFRNLCKNLVSDFYANKTEELNNSQLASLGQKSPMRLNTEYESIFTKKRNAKKIPSYEETSPIFNDLKRAFDYIEMSPEKATDQQVGYYIRTNGHAVPNIEDYFNTNNARVNQSAQFANTVLKFWCNKARDLVTIHDDYSKKKKVKELSQFLLLGKPGTGKTSFLNYIFSVNSNECIKSNVIWIRVDLNKPEKKTLELKERVVKKFIRIFSRYYYGDSVFNYPSFEDSYFKFTQENKQLFFPEIDNIALSQLTKSFFEFIHAIKNECNKLKAKHKPCSLLDIPALALRNKISDSHLIDLCDSLMMFIQQKYKVGYIIIFDGLDSVTQDAVQRERYESWLSQLLKFIDIVDFYFITIATMRNYSYIDAVKNEAKKTRRYSNDFTKLFVSAPRLQHVIQRKSHLAELFVRDTFRASHSDIENIMYNIVDIVNMCYYNLTPETYVSRFVNDAIKPYNYVKDFYSLFNENLRSMMRFFRLCFDIVGGIFNKERPGDDTFYFLNKERGNIDLLSLFYRKRWIIQHFLISGDINFSTVYSNRVRFDIDDGKPQIDTDHNSIIPNIFNFKDSFLREQDDLFPRNLLKIHALQYLINEASEFQAPIDDLIRFLQDIYSCSKDTLRDDITEMILNGLILPVIEGQEVMKSINYRVKLTHFGSTIYNSILQQAIYYEIIADNTPIANDYTKHIVPLNRYETGFNIQEYLCEKANTIAVFLFYLQKLQLSEKIAYNAKYAGSTPYIQDPYNEMGLNVFNDALIEKIMDNLASYFEVYILKAPISKQDQAFDSIAESLEAHISHV